MPDYGDFTPAHLSLSELQNAWYLPEETPPLILSSSNQRKMDKVLSLKVSAVKKGENPLILILRGARSDREEGIVEEWRDDHDCNPHGDDCDGDCEDCSCDCTYPRSVSNKIETTTNLFRKIEDTLLAYFAWDPLVSPGSSSVCGAVLTPISFGPTESPVTRIWCADFLTREFLVLRKDGTQKFVPIHAILGEFSSVAGGDDCAYCGVRHAAYGIEAELFAMTEDPDARRMLLKKLNKKLRLDTEGDKYGVDGGGGDGNPLEMRNINGTSIRKVVNTYTRTFGKMMGGIGLINSNFNHVGKSIHTKGCGLHVHQFHPDLPRAAVVTAHSLVGMLVNSMEAETWVSRTNNGYGSAFNHRAPTPWCDSDSATELRMFNVLHPKTLEACMEITAELAKAKKSTGINVGSRDGRGCSFDKFLANQGLHPSQISMKSNFNNALFFFVDSEFATPPEIKAIYDKIYKAYVPPLPQMAGRIPDVLIDEKKIAVPRKKKIKSVQPLVSECPYPDADDTPRPRIQTRCFSRNEFFGASGHGFVCTRPDGHDGSHHAHRREECLGMGMDALWPRESF